MRNRAYRKVLFCIPPMLGSATNKYSKKNIPKAPVCGIGYLSEFLTSHHIENDVIDLGIYYTGNLEATISILRQKIGQFEPDLLAFQVMTYRRDITYRIISAIISPSYHVVIGGHHVSTVRAEALNEVETDFAIMLEGEYPLLELCQGKDCDKIENLIYKDGNTVISNAARAFIIDLDSIPFPRYDKFELGRYSARVIPIVSSRGCPYSCIYCPIHVVIGRQWRARSAESISEELAYWYKRGHRDFDFVDDNFTLRKERVYQLCDLIEKRQLRGLKLGCSNGVRADRTDRELLKRMKEVGFWKLCFGVEAGNNRILENIKKGVTLEKVEEAIKNACELGYEVGLFFMIGHPGETIRDVEDSFCLAEKYPVSFANFYNTIPFPQTELLDWIKQNKYFVGNWQEKLNYAAHYEDTPFFETPEFPLEQRKAMLRAGDKINIQIKKRALSRSLSKFGVVGRLVAGIIYHPSLYPLIVRLFNENRIFESLIRSTIRLLRVEVRHL